MPFRFYAISFNILCFIFFLPYAPTYHSNHVCMWKLFPLIPRHSLTIQKTASRRRLSCMPPLSPTLNTGAPVPATRPREPTWASFNIRSPELPLYLPSIYIYMCVCKCEQKKRVLVQVLLVRLQFVKLYFHYLVLHHWFRLFQIVQDLGCPKDTTPVHRVSLELAQS
jgi:hypothetical protein